MEKLNFTKKEFQQKIQPNYVMSGDHSDFFWLNDEYLIKKFRNEISINEKNQIKKFQSISKKVPIILPNQSVYIDAKLVGFTLKNYLSYQSISNLSLSTEERYEILRLMKDQILRLLDMQIGLYDLDTEHVLYDGKNILFCGVPNAYFMEIKGELDPLKIQQVYEQFNLFTISYLNNIPIKIEKEQLRDALTRWFNLKNDSSLIWVINHPYSLNFCYDFVFRSEEVKRKFLLDEIEIEKIKQKKIKQET